MAKIVRLTEQDLVRLVNKVIKEQNSGNKSSTYTKGDYKKEFSKESFLNNTKNTFLQKGYKVIKNSPLLMKKDNKEVRYETIGKEMIQLTISNYPSFNVIQISLDNFNPMGPFKVEYIKRGNVGDAQTTNVKSLNGSEVWEIFQKFQ